MTARPLLALPLLVALLSCGGGQPAARPPTRSPAPPHPAPKRTIVKNTRVYRAGHTARLQAQHGVALRFTVSRPRSSRSRLSSTHGYPPQHGYYLTFRVRVVNVGTRPVQLGPNDFVVRIRHEGTVTSYDGNAPYSGAPRQLDTTEVDPGAHVAGPLTFDVRRVHGRFEFVPDRSAALAWTF